MIGGPFVDLVVDMLFQDSKVAEPSSPCPRYASTTSECPPSALIGAMIQVGSHAFYSTLEIGFWGLAERAGRPLWIYKESIDGLSETLEGSVLQIPSVFYDLIEDIVCFTGTDMWLLFEIAVKGRSLNEFEEQV